MVDDVTENEWRNKVASKCRLMLHDIYWPDTKYTDHCWDIGVSVVVMRKIIDKVVSEYHLRESEQCEKFKRQIMGEDNDF